MRKSFKDQMLDLGLVNKKKHGDAKREDHLRKKGKTKADEIAEMNAELVRKAQETRKAKAREHNRKREEKLQQREAMARIKQLVESNRLAKDDSGPPYRFNYLGKIHRIFVEQSMASRLAAGVYAIVCLDDVFEVIPVEVADKIRAIDRSFFIMQNEKSAGAAEDGDDPYSEYQVPDDLIW